MTLYKAACFNTKNGAYFTAVCTVQYARFVARGLCFCDLLAGGPRTNQYNLPGQVIVNTTPEDPEDFDDPRNPESKHMKAETFVAK